MNKRNSLALFALLVGLIRLFTLNLSAQNKVLMRDNQLQNLSLEIKLLQKYIEISALPSGRKQKFFSNVSNEEKANFFKLHLALQFIKRPALTEEQKDVISGALLLTSPDIYDKSNPEKRAKTEKNAEELHSKSLAVFPPNEAYEIFASLGDVKEEVPLLQKYLNVVSPFSRLSKH
jgi:hypothetical protein